jgi:nucleotide-binding universal stress UspA family protein
LKKILLLLSTTRKSPKSINTALEIAGREKAELLILFILDYELSQNIIQQLTQEGWIGGKATEDLHTAIMKEYFAQGKLKIADIEKQAKDKGISCRSIYTWGKFVEVALNVINKEKVDLIIVTRRKRSNLSRFIFGSPVAQLKEQVKCEIKIIDEQDDKPL